MSYFVKIKKPISPPKEKTTIINSKFKLTTDLLLFTDNKDVDMKDYLTLFKSDYNNHLSYFLDKFYKSSNVSWGDSFWSNRFLTILSLKDKKINRFIENKIIKRIKGLLKNKKNININYNIEYLQFVEFCKAKSQLNLNTEFIKKFLCELPNFTGAVKINSLLKDTTPYIFSSFEEYFQYLSKNILYSSKIFKIFSELEKFGNKIDRAPLAQLMDNLLKSNFRLKTVKSFFLMLLDKDCLEEYKKIYNDVSRHKLLQVLDESDHLLFDSNHFLNVRNIFQLDPSIVDQVVFIYLEKICDRDMVHQKANADKILNLLKNFKEASPKKILSWLSKKKKNQEIKFILQQFPDLEKLWAFV